MAKIMSGRASLAMAAVVLAFFTISPARAAAVHDFHDAVAGAFAHYREAVYYLSTGNGSVALFELDRMTAKWDAVERRFADAPPDIYANDTAWRGTLAAVGDAIEAGLAAAAVAAGVFIWKSNQAVTAFDETAKLGQSKLSSVVTDRDNGGGHPGRQVFYPNRFPTSGPHDLRWPAPDSHEFPPTAANWVHLRQPGHGII